MYIKNQILCCVVGLLTFAAELAVLAGPQPEMNRLDHFASKMNQLQNAVGLTHDYGTALADIVQDRQVIPENGVVHVVGPWTSASEWLVFAMLRKDITVIVSESGHDRDSPDLFEEESFRPENIRNWWETYRHEPQLRGLLNRAQRSENEILNLVQGRNNPNSKFRLAYSRGNKPAQLSDGKNLPLADFVFTMMPQDSGRALYPTYGKSGALGWVVTETFQGDFEGGLRTPTELLAVRELNQGTLSMFRGPDSILRAEGPATFCEKVMLKISGPRKSWFERLGRPFVFQVK